MLGRWRRCSDRQDPRAALAHQLAAGQWNARGWAPRQSVAGAQRLQATAPATSLQQGRPGCRSTRRKSRSPSAALHGSPTRWRGAPIALKISRSGGGSTTWASESECVGRAATAGSEAGCCCSSTLPPAFGAASRTSGWSCDSASGGWPRWPDAGACRAPRRCRAYWLASRPTCSALSPAGCWRGSPRSMTCYATQRRAATTRWASAGRSSTSIRR